jgi:hypothetical protein
MLTKNISIRYKDKTILKEPGVNFDKKTILINNTNKKRGVGQ